MDCYPQNPIILVVSPLTSVIEDQLKSLSKRNVSALALPVGFEEDSTLVRLFDEEDNEKDEDTDEGVDDESVPAIPKEIEIGSMRFVARMGLQKSKK